MPKPKAFLDGFGLANGSTMAGYTIKWLHMTHTVVARYREYSFTFELKFLKNEDGDPEELFREIKTIVKSTKDIKGIKNYYHCYFEPPEYCTEDGNGDIVMKFIGHAYR